ncbi:glycosyltransferase, partial [bacterium]|nr:glycosyltransferase [bacterium]MBU1024606.1 glycosyltransferase [bacterium]
MPRILHIINNLNLGGAEVVLLDILKYSNRDDFDFHILLPYGEGELDNRARDMGLNLHYLKSGKTSGKISLYIEGVAEIRRLKPDLIHTHTRFSDLLGLYGGRQAGVKIRMMTVHAAGLYFLDSKPLYEGIIEYGVVRFASHFAVISKAVGEYIQKYGNVNPKLITLIYNGIDPERVCPKQIRERNLVRSELEIARDEFVIFSMGRLIPEKGFDILLDEFKIFRDQHGRGHLIIVGYGPQMDALNKKAKELSISQFVYFAGRIENPAELM